MERLSLLGKELEPALSQSLGSMAVGSSHDLCFGSEGSEVKNRTQVCRRNKVVVVSWRQASTTSVDWGL